MKNVNERSRFVITLSSVFDRSSEELGQLMTDVTEGDWHEAKAILARHPDLHRKKQKHACFRVLVPEEIADSLCEKMIRTRPGGAVCAFLATALKGHDVEKADWSTILNLLLLMTTE